MRRLEPPLGGRGQKDKRQKCKEKSIEDLKKKHG
jgi:hypothetical protein